MAAWRRLKTCDILWHPFTWVTTEGTESPLEPCKDRKDSKCSDDMWWLLMFLALLCASASLVYLLLYLWMDIYSGLVIHSCHRSHAPRNPWSAEFFQAAFALASPSTAPIIQTSFAPAQRFPFCATPHWGGRTDWKMVCGCMSQNGDWHGLAILNMTETSWCTRFQNLRSW